MRVIVTKNKEEMENLTVHMLIGEMLHDQNKVNMCLTAGSTPAGVYAKLAEEVKGKEYYNHVHYYNFDEIPHKVEKKEGTTIEFLRESYLDKVGVEESHIHKLDENTYDHYDEMVQKEGGLDCILLGIGLDGHFAGDLPGYTAFENFTYKVDCDDYIRNDIAECFDYPEDIPDFYVTMGPRSFMQAKKLIMIAHGEAKAEIVDKFVNGKITVDVPSSILRTHPDITLIVDTAAGAKLNK